MKPVWAVVLVAIVAIPFVVSAGPRVASALLDGHLAQPDALAAPPALSLDSPRDGEGVNLTLQVVGRARADATQIRDIDVRIDGGRWQSLPDAPTGAAASAFASQIALEPGPHLVEARASDGSATSPIVAARVLAGSPVPPTVRIASPQQGDGVVGPDITASGTVVGASSVLVRWDDEAESDATLAGGVWTARASLAPGAHVLQARGVAADGPGLAARVEFLVGASLPPSARIVQPSDGAVFGSAGDAACAPRCIMISGVAAGAASVRVDVDGGEPQPATLVGGAWSWPLATDALYSGDHQVRATPVDAEGASGISQTIDITVRTSRQLVVSGDEVPRLTGTALQFRAAGVASASWRLDGAALMRGADAMLMLARPGPHRLALDARDSSGRSASLAIPLVALDRAPTARLSVASQGYEATFRCEATDADGSVVLYRWSFGDGAQITTSAPNATHRYASERVFVASVAPQDDQGLLGATASIQVSARARGPVVSFSWQPESPTILDAVRFDDATTSDTAGTMLRSWSFDDAPQASAPNVSSTFTHQFSTRGAHTVQLRVTDAKGLVSTRAQTVVVVDIPPSPDFGFSPAAPTPGQAVSFADMTGKLDGVIVTRAWDFGDGSIAGGAGATHAFGTTGDFPVTLTVTDDAGVTATLTKRVSVVESTIHVGGIHVAPESPRTGVPIRFFLDADEVPARILWQFGDNATSTELSPLHAFAAHGVYHGNVTVLDGAGHVVQIPLETRVDANAPRVAIEVTSGGYAQFPTLLVANVTPAEGAPVRYRFDADGDGRADCDGPEPRCLFTYLRPDSYGATLVVTDEAGANGTGALALAILPPPSTLVPPAVSVRAPVSGDELRGAVLLVGTASSPRGIDVVDVQLRRDAFAYSQAASAWSRANGQDSWSLLLDTRAFDDGPYVLAVRARALDGGENTTLSPIAIANGAPVPEITVALTDAPATPIRGAIILHGAAYHPAGVGSVRWQMDDGAWANAEGPAISFRIPLDASQLARGNHSLVVEAARGLAERARTSATLRVGGAAPALVIDDAPNPVSYGLIHAAGRLVGPGHVEYRVDDDVWRDAEGNASWTLQLDTSTLANGRHTVSLRALGEDAGEPSTFATHVLNPPTADPSEHAAPAAPPKTRATPFPAWLPLVALGFALLRRRL